MGVGVAHLGLVEGLQRVLVLRLLAQRQAQVAASPRVISVQGDGLAELLLRLCPLGPQVIRIAPVVMQVRVLGRGAGELAVLFVRFHEVATAVIEDGQAVRRLQIIGFQMDDFFILFDRAGILAALFQVLGHGQASFRRLTIRQELFLQRNAAGRCEADDRTEGRRHTRAAHLR